jgi:hypothetical protein
MSTSVRTPPPPPAPTPVDPGQSALAFVRSMADPQLQGEILRNEQLYAPQYTNLELQQINQLMSGSEGLPGVLELQRQAAEQAGGIERSILGQQRAADIADVERLGGRASAAFLQANPQLASALDRAEQLQAGGMDVDSQIRELSRMGIDPVQAQQIARGEFDVTAARVGQLVEQGIPQAQAAQIAQSELGGGLQQAGMGQLQAGAGEAMIQQQGMDFIGRGGALTPLQQRAVEQQARSAGVARGRELDSSSITNEIANRLAQEMQVEQQNVSMGAGLLGQGFGMQQQRLGAASGIYGQDLSRAQANAAMQQQASLANQAAALQGRGQGIEALLQLGGQRASMAAQDASMGQQAALANQDARLRQQGLGMQGLLGLGQLQQGQQQANRSFAMNLIGARQATASDPFQAILGRPSQAPGMGMAQSQFGANLAQQQMGPNLFDPNAGINLALQQNQNLANYQSNIFGSQASLAGAQSQARGAMLGGLFSGLGAIAAAPMTGGTSLAGKFLGCWVAREVYGEDNPKWRIFREWLTFCAPKWFYNLYVKHGERFAAWLKGKHVLKGIIRHWMDGRVETMFKLNEREETC